MRTEGIMNEEHSSGSRESLGRIDTYGKVKLENDNNSEEKVKRVKTSNADDSSNKSNVGVLELGGTLDQPAFCLLDGVFYDPEGTNPSGIGGNRASNPYQRVTLPIRHLPSILGRTHKTDDVRFVGISAMKALSRQLCRIEYRTSSTVNKNGVYGQLQSKIPGTSELHYVKSDNRNSSEVGDESVVSHENTPKNIVTDEQHEIPTDRGFFVVTVVGKNRMFVNDSRLDQGDTAFLFDGSKIKFSSFSLRFFIPEAIKPAGTIEIPNDEPISSLMNNNSNRASSSNSVTQDNTSMHVLRGTQALQLELESVPTNELLKLMSNAIDENVWDRKHQLIGAIISYRAALDAAYDAGVIELAVKNKGEISRGEVMDWIANSDKYSDWVEQMLSKMEQKSYQASITKGMVKADFKRTTSTGRYVKWHLPDIDTIRNALSTFGETMKVKTKQSKNNNSSSKRSSSPTNKRPIDSDNDDIKRQKISINGESEDNIEMQENEDSSEQSIGDRMNSVSRGTEEENDADDSGDNDDDDNDDDNGDGDNDDGKHEHGDSDESGYSENDYGQNVEEGENEVNDDDDDDDDDENDDDNDSDNSIDDADDDDNDEESSGESLGVSNSLAHGYPHQSYDKVQSEENENENQGSVE